MKALFGLVGLLVTLAVVGLLVKKQLDAHKRPAPPAVLVPSAGSAPSGTATTVREQAQDTQQQVRQQMEQLMQQPRPKPDGE